MVWLSQYFQHLEPTFKNQGISHKNSEALADLDQDSHEATLLLSCTGPASSALLLLPIITLRMAGFGTQSVWSLLDVRLLGSVCLSVYVHTTNLQKIWVLLCEANLNACICMNVYMCTCMKPVCVGNVCKAMHVCVCMEGGIFMAMWSVWAIVVWHTLHRGLFRPLRENRIPSLWLGCLVGFISVSVPTEGLSNGNF